MIVLVHIGVSTDCATTDTGNKSNNNNKQEDVTSTQDTSANDAATDCTSNDFDNDTNNNIKEEEEAVVYSAVPSPFDAGDNTVSMVSLYVVV